MSIDWEKFYKNPVPKLDPRTRKEQITFKEQMAKAHAQEAAQRKAEELAANNLPILKKALLNAMVNRTKIQVVRPITTIVEQFVKSQKGGSFQQTQEIIPQGTELTFSHLDTQMNQFIFKSETGKEYEIYATPTIAVGTGVSQQGIQNPGYFGLLYNTSILRALEEALNESEN